MATMTNEDVFGVAWGRCKQDECECIGCPVEAASLCAEPPQIKCFYCEYAPTAHGKLNLLGKLTSKIISLTANISFIVSIAHDFFFH